MPDAMPDAMLPGSPALTRRPPSAPGPDGGLGLAAGRVHELCGPGRRTLALVVAAALPGPVVWIAPARAAERLHPEGVLPLLDPARLIFVTPRRAEDLMWCLEEALRSGAAAAVVAELAAPPGLTPVRRLHLAAEAAAGPHRPTGLILTPGDGGAAGVESRWHLAPRHGPGGDRWRLERRRARTAPPAAWDMTLPRGALRLAPAAAA